MDSKLLANLLVRNAVAQIIHLYFNEHTNNAFRYSTSQFISIMSQYCIHIGVDPNRQIDLLLNRCLADNEVVILRNKQNVILKIWIRKELVFT